jgi:hypothetical protein
MVGGAGAVDGYGDGDGDYGCCDGDYCGNDIAGNCCK